MNALKLVGLFCIALIIVFGAGCKDNETNPPTGSGPGTAQVRLVQASPNAPVVDVIAGSIPIATNLAYRQVTDYESVPANSYKVEVFPAGTRSNPLIKRDMTLSAGRAYTILSIGMLENIRPLVLVDDRTDPPAGQAKVRFIHASPDAPALDIGIPSASLMLTRNLAFGSASPYITVNPGTYDVSVAPSGQGDNVVLTVPDVSVESGKVYTVIAMGRVATNTLMSTRLIDNE